jgi:uncharacterized membrane protein YgcG
MGFLSLRGARKIMLQRKFAIFLWLLLLGISIWGQSASEYPARKGMVNDYAGKLDKAQIKELTGLLQRYEQQTSIEFVVAVVDSLEGQPAGAYAIGLGDSWHVGKAGQNNGIVLLWAPAERAYSLRIAKGLSSELSDEDATRITRQYLVPYFKREEYYAGLKETILAVMERLSDKSWEQRLEGRAALERLLQHQRAAQEQEAARQRAMLAEENKKAEQGIFRVVLFFVAAAGMAVLIWRAIVRASLRKSRLAEMAGAEATVAEYLHQAEKNAPEAQALLDEFAQEMPEQDIHAMRDSLAHQPERILKIQIDLQCLNLADVSSYEGMVRARRDAEGEAELLANTKQTIAQIKAAKAQSQAMMAELQRGNFQAGEVRDTARVEQINQLLLESQQEYEQARQNSSMSVLDWLLINQLLNSSHARFQQAVLSSQEPPYVPPRRIYNDDNDDNGSRSSSGSFWSSDSSSSSSFSGGSGSDGSY